ncbi:hypothetical protein Pedsa_2933 [Pseudopedobacter saltans DSM 12145]|uniref:DUF4288 domain-containing protein n=1 Tax=Pseudopedobacter saltans (strain ATCC 51119 / DSM 12145 / JCM 21818 / CCUG 39354 / LMG 10337 / NBRC 100064 / NCIMB 13643) TaxID=762903 RepID=F0S8Y5_PSESL|nr:DUF4288 domain-containing protein [Pseudopedobacter saltans]ADY53472.1 hypothetical protein Pedsa_2933 [Pseudopedobacter saltans DSM 12145]
MEWYSAKLVYQISNTENDTVQFDEQLRIINAISKELAYEIANQLGYINQEKVVTDSGATLNWNFIAVTEVKYIGEVKHGAEIYSSIKDTPKELFLEETSKKAAYLKDSYSTSLEKAF